MSILIAAAAYVASPRTSSLAEGRAFAHIERAAAIGAKEWTQPATTLQRRERIVKDEEGNPQLQRITDYE